MPWSKALAQESTTASRGPRCRCAKRAISAVRSATGALGGTQDGVNAALSFTSGTGGLLYGAALGLVGIGLVTAATVGKLVYDQAKAAQQYEGSARDFLQASASSASSRCAPCW